MPVVTCPGIFPLLLTLTWSRQTKLAAVVSPILGLAGGLGVWLGLTQAWYGEITIATTSQQMPSLWGSLVSLFGPLVLSITISLVWPQRFDWREFLRIDLIEDKSPPSTTTPSVQNSSLAVDEHLGSEDKNKQPEIEIGAVPQPIPPQMMRSELNNIPLDQVVHPFDEQTMRHVKKWLKIATVFLIVNWTVTILLWPLPLHRNYIFTKSFFSGWVAVSLIWQFFALFAVVIYPIWDGRHVIARAYRGLVKDLKARTSKKEV